jgi:hypothetical protein
VIDERVAAAAREEPGRGEGDGEEDAGAHR